MAVAASPRSMALCLRNQGKRMARVAILATAVSIAALGVPGVARADAPNGWVVSDLHLGEGVSSALEDFHGDEWFSDFVDYVVERDLVRGREPAPLILLGDTFDFLKVVTPPEGEEFPKEGPMSTNERDISPT